MYTFSGNSEPEYQQPCLPPISWLLKGTMLLGEMTNSRARAERAQNEPASIILAGQKEEVPK